MIVIAPAATIPPSPTSRPQITAAATILPSPSRPKIAAAATIAPSRTEKPPRPKWLLVRTKARRGSRDEGKKAYARRFVVSEFVALLFDCFAVVL
jgi:hypothetical protein